MTDHPEPQQGDSDLAYEDHRGYPPRELIQGGQADQSGTHQCLVCDGVRDLAEGRDQTTAPSKVAVDEVSERGEREYHERPHPVPRRLP